MALTKCSDCGSTISKSAYACPKCGRPTKRRGKKPGCVTRFLAACLLLALCIGGLKTCGSYIFAPDTPEQAAKREQEETVRAEKQRREAQSEAEKWKQEEAKQPERREFIQSLIDRGIFVKTDLGSRTRHGLGGLDLLPS